ncbi:Flavin carrier protein 2 [Spathaspora sp. JA1]|nr:Flavin carrier protein 2 [Spathaspora sp. JA1]
MAANHITSTSLLTCMDNSQFTSSLFQIYFFPDNNTFTFNVVAISSIDNRNVTANVNLIAYGLNILQRNISLCDLDYQDASANKNNNPLCPLSSGHLDLSSSYTVSASVTKDIPGVAYTIPDLDARVRVVVFDSNSHQQLACVEAVLSNGKTVQTKYAAWPIAAVAGLGVITSGVISVIGHSSTAAHIASNSMSLFVYFQSLVITAMMAVARVPPIAAAWAQNFVWSMGIVKVGFVQNIANWYIQATGGTPTDIIKSNYISVSVQKKLRLIKRAAMEVLQFTPVIGKLNIVKRASISLDQGSFGLTDNLDPALYTIDEKDPNIAGKILVLRGIQRVAYLAGIEITDLFMTGIIFLFFFGFVMVVCLMVFKAVIEILIRSKLMNEGKFNEYRQQWTSIIKGTLYRLMVLSLPQIALLSLWQFVERDSPGTVVVAVFLLIISVSLLFQAAIRVFIKGRQSVTEFKNPAYLLFGDGKFLNRFGFLYVQFRADCYYFVLITLSYIFIKSLFVAVLQHQGMAQSVIVFAVELIYLVVLCWIRPFMDKRTNAFNITIGVINTINALFFMFFSNIFKQPQVVSSVMAVVYFVLNAVFALFLLLFTIVTCVLALIYKNPDTRYQPMKDDRVSFLPRFGKDDQAVQPNQEDMELMELGATAMKGHEHSGVKKFGDDDDVSEYTGDQQQYNPIHTNSSSNVYDESSKRESFSFDSDPIQPNSTIVGNPYNVGQSQRGGFSYGNTPGANYNRAPAPPQNPFNQQTSYSRNNSGNFI